MKLFSLQSQVGELLIRHFFFGRIDVGVEHRLHNQPCRHCRAGDQIHNCLPIDEWLASPVLSDKAEQALFELVALACPRWKMTNDQFQPEVIGQVLHAKLSETRATAVAAATISRDQKVGGVRKPQHSHLRPPLTNAVGCETSGIMIDPEPSAGRDPLP
jgi:hypothetical protein